MRGPKTTCKLRKISESRTSTGGFSESTDDIVTFDAIVAPITAREQVFFDKETVFATHRLMVDYSAFNTQEADQLVEKSKIVIGTTVYDIKQVQNYHNRHYELLLRRTE